jgi:hypothetical protein
MKTLARHSLSLAVLGGLVGALGAILFLPAYAADAELVALVIGALALYALGALAMVELNRSRAAALRFAHSRARARARAARNVIVPLPARAGATDEERLAA